MKNSNTMLNNKKDTMSYDDANILTLYLKDISRIPLLTREEELDLTRRVVEGDELARKKMIEANLRFVVNVAKK